MRESGRADGGILPLAGFACILFFCSCNLLSDTLCTHGWIVAERALVIRKAVRKATYSKYMAACTGEHRRPEETRVSKGSRATCSTHPSLSSPSTPF